MAAFLNSIVENFLGWVNYGRKFQNLREIVAGIWGLKILTRNSIKKDVISKIPCSMLPANTLAWPTTTDKDRNTNSSASSSSDFFFWVIACFNDLDTATNKSLIRCLFVVFFFFTCYCCLLFGFFSFFFFRYVVVAENSPWNTVSWDQFKNNKLFMWMLSQSDILMQENPQ